MLILVNLVSASCSCPRVKICRTFCMIGTRLLCAVRTLSYSPVVSVTMTVLMSCWYCRGSAAVAAAWVVVGQGWPSSSLGGSPPSPHVSGAYSRGKKSFSFITMRVSWILCFCDRRCSYEFEVFVWRESSGWALQLVFKNLNLDGVFAWEKANIISEKISVKYCN